MIITNVNMNLIIIINDEITKKITAPGAVIFLIRKCKLKQLPLLTNNKFIHAIFLRPEFNWACVINCLRNYFTGAAFYHSICR
jgi:hypothetical protein